MKKIEDKDVEKLIDSVIQVLPLYLSTLFGEKIDVKLTAIEESKKEYVSTVTEFLQSVNRMQIRIDQMLEEKIDPSDILVFYLIEMDSIIRLIDPEIPRDQHFVDYYIDFYTEALKEPSKFSFIRETRYKHYKNLLRELMVKIVDLKRGDKIEQFLERVGKSEDSIVIAQAFFLRLINDYRFLEKTRLRITKKTIDRYIKIYGEFAGHFEKLIGMVVGLVEILRKNELPVYSELREESLAKKEWKLRKDSEFSELVIPFNRTIRNAIAHSNYVFLPLDKKIKFIDLEESVEISYREFENQVKELSSVVLVFSQIRLIFLLIIYHMYKQVLERKATGH